jgi:hypothetical protein
LTTIIFKYEAAQQRTTGKFYEEEIKKILSDYKAYLDSKCIDLVNKNELYVGSFEYIDEVRIKLFSHFQKTNYLKQKSHLQQVSPNQQML